MKLFKQLLIIVLIVAGAQLLLMLALPVLWFLLTGCHGYTGNDRDVCRYSNYCQTDVNGRELYYAYCSVEDIDRKGDRSYTYYEFAVVLNADGSYSLSSAIPCDTPADSAAAVAKLKQDIGWNISQ